MERQENRINWYPGHMARSRRLLQDQLKRTDVVVEVCDARLPHSSRNPDLNRMTRGKKRILLLNKADLADPKITEKWLELYRRQGLTAAGVNALKGGNKEILSLISRETKEIAGRAAERGIRKTLRGMIIGVPNVGKSTLINRLSGGRTLETGDRPGVTRSNRWVKITPYLELLDTPGMLWPRLDDQEAARRLCYIGTVKDDVVDLEDLALHLLEDLARVRPDSLKERFHVEDPGLRGAELMDAVCRGRGWLLKGGRMDYDRLSHVVLDEFRAGRLGRITLETPEGEEPAEEERNGRENEDHPGGSCPGAAPV